jgi:hypothetical protein
MRVKVAIILALALLAALPALAVQRMVLIEDFTNVG